MQARTKRITAVIALLAAVALVLTMFFGVSQRASAMENETEPVSEIVLQAEPAEGENGGNAEEEGSAGYASLFFLFDGAMATALMGIQKGMGWQMGLWISLLFWILILLAMILLSSIVKNFTAKNEKPFNQIALIGFLLSIFFPIAGAVLSFIGLHRRKTHEGGKLYYIGGLVISAIFVVVTIVVAIVHANAPFLPF